LKIRPDGRENSFSIPKSAGKSSLTGAVLRSVKPNPAKFLGTAASGVGDHAGAGGRSGQNDKLAHRLRMRASCFSTRKMRKIYLDKGTRLHRESVFYGEGRV